LYGSIAQLRVGFKNPIYAVDNEFYFIQSNAGYYDECLILSNKNKPSYVLALVLIFLAEKIFNFVNII